MPCLGCIQNRHMECRQPKDADNEECCCESEPTLQDQFQGSNGISGSSGEMEEGTKRGRGRVQKEDSILTDAASTGRKRAAKLYKVDPESPCEWRGKSNCGGGGFPIQGCIDGLQEHRHHGPDKNTLNNDRSNISLICVNCHNRWHARNDKLYYELLGEGQQLLEDELSGENGETEEDQGIESN